MWKDRSERSRSLGFIRFYSERTVALAGGFRDRLRVWRRSGALLRTCVFASLMVAAVAMWQTGVVPAETDIALFGGQAQSPATKAETPLQPAPGMLRFTERTEAWVQRQFDIVPGGRPSEDDAGDSARSESDVEPAAVAPSLPEVVDFTQMIWPVTGEVQREFGWYRHPETNDWRFHAGLLLVPNRESAPVRAVLDGVVDDIRTSGTGYEVRVRHADGWITEYQGLSDLSIGPGSAVEVGDTIGVMARAPHRGGLLFALRQQGEAIDPTSYLYQR